MMIDKFDHWQPARGTLVRVVPTAGAVEAATVAPAHPVPASLLQEQHLRGSAASAARDRPHSVYLVATTEIDGRFDGPALARAMRRFVDRHDGLRSWFELDDGIVTRHLVDTTVLAFEVGEVGKVDDYGWVRGMRAPDSDGTRARRFTEVVDEQFGRVANALSWPGFGLGAVVRERGFTLFYVCDHALGDGISQAMVCSELADHYFAERDGTDVGPFTAAPAGSSLRDALAERERALEHGEESDAVAGWLEIARRNGNRMAGFALDLGLGPGDTAPVRGIKFDVLDADGARAFDEVCTAHGGRTVAGILATLAVVERELCGTDRYWGITVLGDRELADVMVTQGWFCRFAPVSFDTGDATCFGDLVGPAHTACRSGKGYSYAAVDTVIGAMLAAGADARDVLVTPQLVSYIDFRKFPLAGTPVFDRGMQLSGEGRTANASMWFNRDENGIYVGTQTPDTPYAQEQLERYHARLREVFNAVATLGDHRISVTDEEHLLARHHH